MSIGIELKESFEAQVDWEQIFTDIKEKFNIDLDIDELIEFCSDNETKYVKILDDMEYEKYHIDNEGELEKIED